MTCTARGWYSKSYNATVPFQWVHHASPLSHAPSSQSQNQRKCGTPKRKAEIRPRGSERWKRKWSGESHAKLAASCAGQCFDTKWCGCYEFERDGKDMGYCKLYKRGDCDIKKNANNKTFAGRCWGKM